jgi:L-2-hydroxyglutarate oxidase LhgO
MDEIDVVVIGAGVVGLAVARTLALAGREVLVLEAAATIGTGTSSRNSEVIHAGLYYEPGSLKARLCVSGRELLYAYCDSHGVAYRRCGKLLVATTQEQMPKLAAIETQARSNGVSSLRHLSAEQARALEPALHCVAALHSPDTGIVDSHQLMLALQGDAEAHGAICAFRAPVQRIEREADGRFRIEVGDDVARGGVEPGGEPGAPSGSQSDMQSQAQPFMLRAQHVVNCAGLQAQTVASRIQGLAARHVPPLYMARGNYFSLSGRSPFDRLIYPMPDEAGLGVHLTVDLGGQAKFGPDVEWVDAVDYQVDPHRADSFYAAIRTYWPDLADGALQPAYAGIRPKLVGPGQPAADFMVQGEPEHGVKGLLNFFGIESPGLTASLALAEYAAARLT